MQSGGQVVRNIVKKDPTDFEKAILKLQDNNETKVKPNSLGVPLTVSRSTNDLQAIMSK